MPRLAVLFDVHGNIDALDAVLAAVDAQAVDGLVAGGDLALFGPAPGTCVARLRERGVASVRGNTDRYLADGPTAGHPVWAADGPAAWTAELLGQDALGWLGALPLRLDPLPGIAVVHATPRSDEETLAPETPDDDAAAMLADATDAQLILGGHTHVQFQRDVHGRTFANPGSVGLPFDGDARAAWAIVDATGAVELQRTPYDVEAAIARLAASGSPAADLITRRLRAAAAVV